MHHISYIKLKQYTHTHRGLQLMEYVSSNIMISTSVLNKYYAFTQTSSNKVINIEKRVNF